MARMKFRLFHLILESCKFSNALFLVVTSRVRICSGYYPGTFWENSSIAPSLLNICTQNAKISVVGRGYLLSVGDHAVFIFCISDAHIFTADPSSVCDYGYHAWGELSRFTYCLLQKIKSAQSLPRLRNGSSSCFPIIRGSLLFRRKSAWREVGLIVRWRK